MSRAEPGDRRLPEEALVFAALGDPTRLSLLARLGDGETRSITMLSTGTALTRQAVTKHLRVLKEAGLVASLRVGRESRFVFRPEPVQNAKRCLDRISRQWDKALGRLRARRGSGLRRCGEGARRVRRAVASGGVLRFSEAVAGAEDAACPFSGSFSS